MAAIARAEIGDGGRCVAFSTVGGAPLEGRVVELEVRESGRCRARLEVELAVYRRAVAEGELGFDAPGHAEGDDAGLSGEHPVVLELGLRDHLAGALGGEPEERVEELARALLEPADLDLRRADAWRVIEVAQEGVRMRTPWSGARAVALPPPAMADVVRAVFDSSGWQLEAIDGDEVFRAVVAGEMSTWIVLVRLAEADGLCAVYSVHPARVAMVGRPAAALQLAAFNYRLPSGAFEMDPEDGEVRFRAGLVLGTEPLTEAAFARLLRYNVDVFDAHAPALDELCTESPEA